MASRRLVALARAAARVSAKSATAQRAWADAFEREYGHSDISDVLVGAIDCGEGTDTDEEITSEFIDANSAPGQS